MITKVVSGSKHFSLNLRDDADASVCAEIFKHQEYRRAKEVIERATSPILDVGAHAGFFTLYARSLNDSVPIIALEPDVNNCKALLEHLSLNALQNVTLVQAALAGKTGGADLYIAPDHHNHSLEAQYGASNTVRSIKTYSFSDLCSLYHIERISLVKMDIEGGEYDVIVSLTPPDYMRIEAIIMEYHNFGEKNYKQIEQKLRENGFGVEIFPSHFDKTMGFLWARNKRLR